MERMKNLNKLIKIYLTVFVLAGLVLLQHGCSKQIAPDPPRSRSRLTLELFEALKNKDHKTALAKIERLRSIDKTSLFLAQLQNIESENIAITEAEKALENYETRKAIEILDKAIKLYGQRDALLNAKAQIQSLVELSSCVRELKKPSSSLAMAKAAVTLKKMGEADKSLKIFNGFIKERIEEAFRLEKNENERAFASLAFDIKINARSGNRVTSYMLCELALESPHDPLVVEYMDFLRNKGKSELFTKTVLEE